MQQSFYRYMQTIADPYKQDSITNFANLIVNDVGFPKHEKSFDIISDYIEFTEVYYNYASIFDQLWEQYILKQNNK